MNIINKLEKELLDIVNQDKQNWTHFYLIMKDIEEKELWKEVGERSFTGWVKNFSVKSGIHESIIWNRKKAGKVYESYEKMKQEQGEEVTPIEKCNVSVDTLVLLDRINNKAPKLALELAEKAINKEMTREDLRNAYKSVRGDISKKSDKKENKEDNTQMEKTYNNAMAATTPIKNIEIEEDGEIEEIEKIEKEEFKIDITSSLIINTLNNSGWLGVTKASRKPFKTAFEQDKYRTFTEFPVFPGTSRKSRRIDLLAVENLTCESWEIVIHGIEIKVSKSDLLNDKKYTEYADFVDFMWLAIPKELQEVAKASKFNDCGILVINQDNTIEIVEQAKKLKALLKKDTLTSLTLKLL